MLKGKMVREFVRELRESHGLTQAQLGDLMSVGDDAISRWESEKYKGIITEPYVKLMLLVLNKDDVEWYDNKLNEYRVLKSYELRLKKEGK